jgi:hypothetical protein
MGWLRESLDELMPAKKPAPAEKPSRARTG